MAARDDVGLDRALRLVEYAADTRATPLRAAELRERLCRVGREGAKPDHAYAFLNSVQLRSRIIRSIDYCSGVASFDLVVKLMREPWR
jgi:hypothetical protein